MDGAGKLLRRKSGIYCLCPHTLLVPLFARRDTQIRLWESYLLKRNDKSIFFFWNLGGGGSTSEANRELGDDGSRYGEPITLPGTANFALDQPHNIVVPKPKIRVCLFQLEIIFKKYFPHF